MEKGQHGLRPEKSVHQWSILSLICAVVAILMVAAIYFGNAQLVRWELGMADAFTSQRGGGTASERLVYVGIDDDSLNVLDLLDEEVVMADPNLDAMSWGYPFPRSVYAALAQKLLDAGAELIVFDMLFLTEGKGDDGVASDAALKSLIDANPDRIVIGCNLVEKSVGGTSIPTFDLPPSSIISDIVPLDSRVGYVNFFPEADGKIRSTMMSMRPFAHEDSPLRNSLTMAALTQLGEADKISDPYAEHYARFPEFGDDEADAPPYSPVPFYTLFLEAEWEKNYAGGEAFRDKIVFIGGSSVVGFHDMVIVPEDEIGGPQLHMAVLAAALDGDFYQVTGIRTQILSVFLMAVVAFGMAFVMKRPILGLLALVACAIAYALVVRWVYFDFSKLLPTAAPMLTLGLAGISCFGTKFAMEQMEKARLRRTLERQISKELADHILSKPEDYFESLPGVRKPVTVLFSDIRSFTSRSERDDPVKLVSQLKEYLDAMGKIVHQHGGMVDKFIGDAVMAVWGNVQSRGPEEDSRSAVRAAVAMQERLAEMNAKWEAAGREGFEIGIGLNHGEAIFGLMGSEQKQEMTVIGDPVNQAARLEGLTKKFGLGIVLGPRVAKFVYGDFELRSLGKVRTAGKTEAEELAAVIEGADDTAQADWVRRYHEALAAFERGENETARVAFQNCAEEQPGDLAVQLYLDAIAGGETGGVLVMSGK